MTKKQKAKIVKKGAKRRLWTPEEDALIVKYARVFPHRMSYCFTMVADEIGRTPNAVAYRWYSKVSKRNWIYGFMSPLGICKNRKNGIGTPIKVSVWNKIMAIIAKVCK